MSEVRMPTQKRSIEKKEKIIEKEDLPSTKGCSQQNSYEIIDGILHFKYPSLLQIS